MRATTPAMKVLEELSDLIRLLEEGKEAGMDPRDLQRITELTRVMNKLNPDFQVIEFVKVENDPCWKLPGHEMRAWAEQVDELDPDSPGGHGLGDLDKPCELEPGESCPACGKVGDQ